MFYIVAQIEEKLNEEWKQKIYEEAQVVEKTPPQFFFKAALIIAGVVAFSLLMRKYAKRKAEKNANKQ